MGNRNLPAVASYHSSMPQKCACSSGESQFVDQPGHQRQLLGRPDRAADPDRIVGRRLLPGVDVLQRLGQVEVLQRIVENNLEPRAGQALQAAFVETGGFIDQIRIERGEVPPVRGDVAEFPWHGRWYLKGYCVIRVDSAKRTEDHGQGIDLRRAEAEVKMSTPTLGECKRS